MAAVLDALRVVVAPSRGRVADRELLAAFGSISRACSECGGDHGRPVVAEPGRWVSLSRAGGLVAAAFSTVGPIGVDLESRSAVSRHPVHGLRHPDAVEWATKEAVLKADGRGLRVDPEHLTVADGRLTAWAGCPVPLARMNARHFEVSDDLVGSVAWFGDAVEPLLDLDGRQRRLGSAFS